MIGGIGMPELIIILVVILIIFGAGKLPEIGKGLGKGIRDFKKATSGELEEETKPEEPVALAEANTADEEREAQDPRAVDHG